MKCAGKKGTSLDPSTSFVLEVPTTLSRSLVSSGRLAARGGVFDILQLRRRLAIATQIQEIFAHAPGYKVKRKHSSQADNMTPVDGGPCSLPVNLPELWQEGLCHVQRYLGIQFSDLHRVGVALLAPRLRPRQLPAPYDPDMCTLSPFLCLVFVSMFSMCRLYCNRW